MFLKTRLVIEKFAICERMPCLFADQTASGGIEFVWILVNLIKRVTVCHHFERASIIILGWITHRIHEIDRIRQYGRIQIRQRGSIGISWITWRSTSLENRRDRTDYFGGLLFLAYFAIINMKRSKYISGGIFFQQYWVFQVFRVCLDQDLFVVY